MSKRYQITRALQENNTDKSISLEECKQYFATQPDFTYTTVFKVKGEEATMSIEGDFFMWTYGEALIPFRYYEGDIYVSGANDAVIPRMMEIATDLAADIAEG